MLFATKIFLILVSKQMLAHPKNGQPNGGYIFFTEHRPEGNQGLTCVQRNLYTILKVRTGKPTTIGQHISGLVQVGVE